MRVFLMFRDRDFNFEKSLPPWSDNLIDDLGLEIIFKTMSNGDDFFYEVSKKTLLYSLSDPKDILYRQEILKDCLENPSLVKKLYEIAVDSIEFEKKAYFWFISNKHAESVLHSSARLMGMFLESFEALKEFSLNNREKFQSEGFNRFFSMIESELNDDYLDRIRSHLRDLEFKDGMLVSARIGKGGRGKDYTLRKIEKKNRNIVDKIIALKRESYTFHINERDEAGAKALSELRNLGVKTVANALYKSATHVLKFFKILKAELAFYLSAMNLYEVLSEIGEPVCFPDPINKNLRLIKFEDLRNPSLAIASSGNTVGSSIDEKDKSLFIITGANKGGKSTFIRSIGIAKLMMQAGIFVSARLFSSNVNSNIFTHFKREEDKDMESGKFDEELKRMSYIVDMLDSNSLILFNESFSSTNEIEGSEVAENVISELLEYGVEMFFVTHMYKFARSMFNKSDGRILFLRAQRKEDGERTYKIEKGEPLQTSHGRDIYKKVFGVGDA